MKSKIFQFSQSIKENLNLKKELPNTFLRHKPRIVEVLEAIDKNELNLGNFELMLNPLAHSGDS